MNAEWLRRKWEDSRTKDGLLLLRMARDRCQSLEYQLEQARGERDRLALQAVDDGHTWREVGAAAGFANPHIAHLRRRAALASSLPDRDEAT